MPLRDHSQLVKKSSTNRHGRAQKKSDLFLRYKWVIAFFLAAFVPFFTGAVAPAAAENAVVSVRLGEHGITTRFVIEMKQAADYELFTLSDPYRVVIDLPEMAFNVPDSLGREGRGLISKFRFGQFHDGKSRIVIDTNGPPKVAKQFILQAQAGFGYRIVVDVEATTLAAFQAEASKRWNARPPAAVAARSVLPVVPRSQQTQPTDGKRIIVLDPGHGGVDPGTHGKRDTREKNVVLAFGLELKKRLEATGRYKVYMTRASDVFIPLRKRVEIGRRHKADLFVSLHADASGNSSTRGLSVYTLSETSSDKEAAKLASKENRSDVIAGVDLFGESPEVSNILIDLAQRETKNFSAQFARSVTQNAGRATKLLGRTHRFAGFRVLKAPDIPSVLVELGFLSNREDEKSLRSSKWRRNVATALTRAVDSYFGDRYAEGAY